MGGIQKAIGRTDASIAFEIIMIQGDPDYVGLDDIITPKISLLTDEFSFRFRVVKSAANDNTLTDSKFNQLAKECSLAADAVITEFKKNPEFSNWYSKQNQKRFTSAILHDILLLIKRNVIKEPSMPLFVNLEENGVQLHKLILEFAKDNENEITEQKFFSKIQGHIQEYFEYSNFQAWHNHKVARGLNTYSVTEHHMNVKIENQVPKMQGKPGYIAWPFTYIKMTDDLKKDMLNYIAYHLCNPEGSFT